MRGDSERFREWDRRQWASAVGRSEGIGRPDADARGQSERKPAGTRRNGLVRTGAAADRHLRHPSRCSRASPGSAGIDTTPVSRRGHHSRSNDAAVPAGDEPQSTQLRGHLRTELVPWDDPDFVREYEGAHEQVVREGLLINGPRAAAEAGGADASRRLSARLGEGRAHDRRGAPPRRSMDRAARWRGGARLRVIGFRARANPLASP